MAIASLDITDTEYICHQRTFYQRYMGVGKRRCTVVCKTQFILILLLLYFCIATVNLLLPHSIYKGCWSFLLEIPVGHSCPCRISQQSYSVDPEIDLAYKQVTSQLPCCRADSGHRPVCSGLPPALPTQAWTAGEQTPGTCDFGRGSHLAPSSSTGKARCRAKPQAVDG